MHSLGEGPQLFPVLHARPRVALYSTGGHERNMRKSPFQAADLESHFYSFQFAGSEEKDSIAEMEEDSSSNVGQSCSVQGHRSRIHKWILNVQLIVYITVTRYGKNRQYQSRPYFWRFVPACLMISFTQPVPPVSSITSYILMYSLCAIFHLARSPFVGRTPVLCASNASAFPLLSRISKCKNPRSRAACSRAQATSCPG
jgi:hypothetical protein